METLKLDKPTAIRLFPTAAPEFKTMLETTFGKETFTGKIIDRLTCLADCYDVLGLNSGERPYAGNPRQLAAASFYDATVAIEAINEGWVPDWDNSNEPKYEIVWDMRAGRLVFVDVDCWGSSSCVGSRLCFKNAADAKWAAQQPWFIEICKKFMHR